MKSKSNKFIAQTPKMDKTSSISRVYKPSNTPKTSRISSAPRISQSPSPSHPRKYWWLLFPAAIIIILLIILLIVVLSSNTTPEDTSENQPQQAPNSSASQTIPEPTDYDSTAQNITQNQPYTPKITFKNSSFVTDFIGSPATSPANNSTTSPTAAPVLQIIDTALTEFISTHASPDSLSASAPGSSVDKGISFPYDTLSFTLQLSNGENYNVDIALLKDAYFGVLVSPSDSETPKFYLSYLRPASEAGYSESSAISDLKTWAASIYPDHTFQNPIVL